MSIPAYSLPTLSWLDYSLPTVGDGVSTIIVYPGSPGYQVLVKDATGITQAVITISAPLAPAQFTIAPVSSEPVSAAVAVN